MASGTKGGQFLVEIAVAIEGEGTATRLLGHARKAPQAGKGTDMELQVHTDNKAAQARYTALGGYRCRWRDGTGTLRGQSLHTPQEGNEMWNLPGGSLDRTIATAAATHGNSAPGMRYVTAVGIQGLQAAGLLQGVRALAYRLYSKQTWRAKKDHRPRCLYQSGDTTTAGRTRYCT